MSIVSSQYMDSTLSLFRLGKTKMKNGIGSNISSSIASLALAYGRLATNPVGVEKHQSIQGLLKWQNGF